MTPDQILEDCYQRAASQLDKPFIEDDEVLQRVKLVSRNINNRACVRVILACSLAKIHRPNVDIRKPYTEIGDEDAFSGRTYDERYISDFVGKYKLPCNTTTAFLTPALRNRITVLTPDLNLAGRPREVYAAMLRLLTDVYEERISANDLLQETIRQLIEFKNENRRRLKTLLDSLTADKGYAPLSAEAIVTLIEQHLACKGASRLPVLVVAAAYQAAREHLGEQTLPLEAHNAADSQTHALGDLQITLKDSEQVVTSYEMKVKRVTVRDIDLAIEKIARAPYVIDNYIFITTDIITLDVQEYAAGVYDDIGVEIVVLDCIGFIRHFLHLFHRLRMQFLDAYQQFVLDEPDSAVGQPVKEVFLTLRKAAESGQ